MRFVMIVWRNRGSVFRIWFKSVKFWISIFLSLESGNKSSMVSATRVPTLDDTKHFPSIQMLQICLLGDSDAH